MLWNGLDHFCQAAFSVILAWLGWVEFCRVHVRVGPSPKSIDFFIRKRHILAYSHVIFKEFHTWQVKCGGQLANYWKNWVIYPCFTFLVLNISSQSRMQPLNRSQWTTTTLVFTTLHWLPARKRVMLVWKCLNGTASRVPLRTLRSCCLCFRSSASQVSLYWLTESSQSARTTIGQLSFAVAGPLLWNSQSLKCNGTHEKRRSSTSSLWLSVPPPQIVIIGKGTRSLSGAQTWM